MGCVEKLFALAIVVVVSYGVVVGAAFIGVDLWAQVVPEVVPGLVAAGTVPAVVSLDVLIALMLLMGVICSGVLVVPFAITAATAIILSNEF